MLARTMARRLADHRRHEIATRPARLQRGRAARAVSITGKISRGRQLQRARRQLSGRGLAAFASAVESLGEEFIPTPQIEPRLHRRDSGRRRIGTIAIDLCRDVGATSRWATSASGMKASRQFDRRKGQSDRLRERKTGIAARSPAFRGQAAGQPLAARPHRLHRAARARHRLRPRADRRRCPAQGTGQAQAQSRAPGRRPRRDLGSAGRSGADRDAPPWPAQSLRTAEGADARTRHHRRVDAPLHRIARPARRRQQAARWR